MAQVNLKYIHIFWFLSFFERYDSDCEIKSCDVTSSGVSPDEQANIVEYHNYFRQRIALGEEKNYPESSNMIEFSWDDELAAFSQKWANGCQFEHSGDNCKKSNKWKVAGENLYQKLDVQDSRKSDWLSSVKGWYDEYPHYPVSELGSFNSKSGDVAGHFTQVVWAKTNRVGCGYSTYVDKAQGSASYVQNYVCGYGPTGNVKTMSVYKQGKPCTDCHDKKCGKFLGLCSTHSKSDPEER